MYQQWGRKKGVSIEEIEKAETYRKCSKTLSGWFFWECFIYMYHLNCLVTSFTEKYFLPCFRVPVTFLFPLLLISHIFLWKVFFLLQMLQLRSPMLFWFLWCCIWLFFTPFWKAFSIFTLGILKFLTCRTWCESSWSPFASYLLNPLNIENQVHQLRKTSLHYLFDNFLFSTFFSIFSAL